ncbi:MAG TPA: ROK family protein [Terriglobales bacterium]|jgi:fructokinase|nr:ROK family protein [Terriglobales bacterium]
MFGAIEAGGTKFVCAVGTNPDDLKLAQFPTTSPQATTASAIEFLREQSDGELDAVGIGSFGPVDLRLNSPTFGYITSTPKSGWQNYDFAGVIGAALGVPIGFDTDVNAAALGEAQWGAAQSFSDFLYLTIGTGIGGGAVVNGQVLHGLLHPEMGHIRIPHDFNRDPYPGCCPFHGDCLEGLASGPALQQRWGVPPEDLPANHSAWALEAHYLALGLANWVCTLSPTCILLGGGVMRQECLFAMIRENLARLLNGYVRAKELRENLNQYVIPPRLGNRSGIIGALVLAEHAYQKQQEVAAPLPTRK